MRIILHRSWFWSCPQNFMLRFARNDYLPIYITMCCSKELQGHLLLKKWYSQKKSGSYHIQTTYALTVNRLSLISLAQLPGDFFPPFKFQHSFKNDTTRIHRESNWGQDKALSHTKQNVLWLRQQMRMLQIRVAPSVPSISLLELKRASSNKIPMHNS